MGVKSGGNLTRSFPPLAGLLSGPGGKLVERHGKKYVPAAHPTSRQTIAVRAISARSRIPRLGYFGQQVRLSSGP